MKEGDEHYSGIPPKVLEQCEAGWNTFFSMCSTLTTEDGCGLTVEALEKKVDRQALKNLLKAAAAEGILADGTDEEIGGDKEQEGIEDGGEEEEEQEEEDKIDEGEENKIDEGEEDKIDEGEEDKEVEGEDDREEIEDDDEEEADEMNMLPEEDRQKFVAWWLHHSSPGCQISLADFTRATSERPNSSSASATGPEDLAAVTAETPEDDLQGSPFPKPFSDHESETHQLPMCDLLHESELLKHFEDEMAELENSTNLSVEDDAPISPDERRSRPPEEESVPPSPFASFVDQSMCSFFEAMRKNVAESGAAGIVSAESVELRSERTAASPAKAEPSLPSPEEFSVPIRGTDASDRAVGIDEIEKTVNDRLKQTEDLKRKENGGFKPKANAYVFCELQIVSSSDESDPTFRKAVEKAKPPARDRKRNPRPERFPKVDSSKSSDSLKAAGPRKTRPNKNRSPSALYRSRATSPAKRVLTSSVDRRQAIADGNPKSIGLSSFGTNARQTSVLETSDESAEEVASDRNRSASKRKEARRKVGGNPKSIGLSSFSSNARWRSALESRKESAEEVASDRNRSASKRHVAHKEARRKVGGKKSRAASPEKISVIPEAYQLKTCCGTRAKPPPVFGSERKKYVELEIVSSSDSDG